MRRVAICTATVLALLLAGGPASAARGHKMPTRCPPGHSHLITADTQAQVYLRPEGSGPPGDFQPEEIFGCAYGAKRLYALGGPPGFSSQGGGELTHYTLAGVVLAYESFGLTDFPGPGLPERQRHVVVTNLRTGRMLQRVPTGTSSPSSVGVGPVVTLVVKSDGAVAWIAGNTKEADEHATSYEVHAVDRTGNRLLASGAEIDPHSLALAGSTLYWTQGGKPASAVLN
jgi:hypothetical protein